jgi:hypothetical protein
MSESKTIAIRLSEIERVREYLCATAIDTQGLRTERDKASTEIVPLREMYLAVSARHSAAKKAREFLEKMKAREAQDADYAFKRLLSYNEKFTYDDRSFRDTLINEVQDPKYEKYSLEKHEAWLKVERVKEESRQLLRSPLEHQDEVESATQALRKAEKEHERIIAELSKAQERINRATKQMPEGVVRLDRNFLERLTRREIGDLEQECHAQGPYPREDRPLAEVAGIIRGEIPHACSCQDGFLVLRTTVGEYRVDLILDDECRHPICYHQSHFDASLLAGAVPPSHAEHRVHSLGTWKHSPVPQEAQTKPLGMIRSSSQGLRGWVMAGPSGSSKTTYAAAAVTDMLTFRIVDGARCGSFSSSHRSGEPHPPCAELGFWRVKAPKWLRDMEAYETRDFHADVHETDLTPHLIESMATPELPPILWLEELDKFNPTANRMRNLYTLIDAVYEARGTIISTTNMTLPKLREHLGDPVYRRLTGNNDDPEHFLLWDFFKLCERLKKTPLSKA